jgi:hypothetical protein
MTEATPMELDLGVVYGMLERLGSLIFANERAHATLALELVAEAKRQLQRRGAELTRIQRLFGIRGVLAARVREATACA